MVSAVAYTMMNICMRQLTVLQCDPLWAVFNRELVTAVAVAPWLLWRVVARRTALPWGRTLVELLAVAVLIQLVGNVGVQWAYGVVGLAVSVPAVFGTCIAGSALLGWACLGERVSRRSQTAIAILFASLILLGIGAETASAPDAVSVSLAAVSGRWLLLFGVGAAGMAGVTYALLNIVIRRAVTQTTLPVAVAFLVTLTGAVTLGPCSLLRHDVSPSLGSPSAQFGLMAGAGLFNLIGFLSLIYGLQRTTVVHANAISTLQVAMAAVAGMLLFGEPPNPWLLGGICLTIAGVLRIDRPAEPPEV